MVESPSRAVPLTCSNRYLRENHHGITWYTGGWVNTSISLRRTESFTADCLSEAYVRGVEKAVLLCDRSGGPKEHVRSLEKLPRMDLMMKN